MREVIELLRNGETLAFMDLRECVRQALTLLRAKPSAGEFTKRMKIKWHDMTVQIKPDRAPVSAELPNKLMRDLKDACTLLDAKDEENEKLKRIIREIGRISCGEDQVAEDDSEGMGVIYRITEQAL